MSSGAQVPKRRMPSGMARVRPLWPMKRAAASSARSPPRKDKIDQGRDPETHVVEPDQDAQPVVGEQAEEQGQAELAEVAGALGRVGADGDDRPHRAVLIVPGRVRRLAQERVDDRRHPQAPAQHAHALFDQAFDARAG